MDDFLHKCGKIWGKMEAAGDYLYNRTVKPLIQLKTDYIDKPYDSFIDSYTETVENAPIIGQAVKSIDDIIDEEKKGIRHAVNDLRASIEKLSVDPISVLEKNSASFKKGVEEGKDSFTR